jgi:hypothetical protein
MYIHILWFRKNVPAETAFAFSTAVDVYGVRKHLMFQGSLHFG